MPLLNNFTGTLLSKIEDKFAKKQNINADNYLKISYTTDPRLTTTIYSQGVYDKLVRTLRGQGILDQKALEQCESVSQKDLIVLPLPIKGLTQQFTSNFSSSGSGFLEKVQKSRSNVYSTIAESVVAVKNVAGNTTGFVANDEWSLIQTWKKENSSFNPEFSFSWEIQAINDEKGEIYYLILALILLTVPFYENGLFIAPGVHFGVGKFNGLKLGSLSLQPKGGTKINIKVSNSFFAKWVGIKKLDIDYDLNSITKRGKVSSAKITMGFVCLLPVYNYDIPSLMGLTAK